MRPLSPGPNSSVQVDWEAIWREASGPRLEEGELQLIGDLFQQLDHDDDGVLKASDLPFFHSIFTNALASEPSLPGLIEEDAEATQAVCDLDAPGWISFHVAALALYGRAAWRGGLESVASVCQITRLSAAPEEQDPWTISVRPGGEIISAWFSQAEMRPEERDACKALVNAGGWRCLSCEAEALEPHVIGAPTVDRAITARGREHDPMRHRIVQRAVSLQLAEIGLDLHFPTVKHVSCVLTRDGPPKAPQPQAYAPERSWRSGLWRCKSLREMLSHRAFRPIRKPIRVGDHVIIENVSKGTVKKSHLGMSATVTSVWIPELEVVKREWCQVSFVADYSPVDEVMLPLSSVVGLKVPLRPGDIVESYRPVETGRRRGERCAEVYKGTVLGLDQQQAHLLEVRFAADDTAKVPLSWVRRAEMSAWTQVLRRAPHSTLMFLLFELGLLPETPQDLKELEERVRRDFEPHGRFRYVGSWDAWTPSPQRLSSSGSLKPQRSSSTGIIRPTTTENGTDASPTRGNHRSTSTGRLKRASMQSDLDLSPSRTSSDGDWTPLRARLAKGDTGKILSFDLKKLEAEVLPDRKKHLHLRVRLDALRPEPYALEKVAICGPTRMHAFAEDEPLLAAVKQGDTRQLRKLLREITPPSAIAKALLEENVDADGNSVFHAAVYAQSVEMWRVVWSALCTSKSDTDEEQQRALNAINDWGFSPLAVAIECGNVALCALLLSSGAPVHQETPVMPSSEDASATYDFCGGPGLVAAGATFEVTLYTPSATCGLRFGHQSCFGDGRFVVVRTFGEAAEACIMPGDVLLTIEMEAAATFGTFRELERRLARASCPLTLSFRKGSGLFIRPLHRACELGNDKVVQLLLEKSADPSWSDVCGRSAMDRAVRKRNRLPANGRAPFDRCIALLVEAGVSEEGRVRIFDADGVSHPFDPPPHWSNSAQRALEGRFWLQVDEVPPGPAFNHLRTLVDRSIGTSGLKQTTSKDRRDRTPKKLVVERVQRVENVASLREYLQHRYIMKQAIGSARVDRVPTDKVKVSYVELAGMEVKSPLDESINEVFLFHGTSPAGVNGILLDDFQLALAGSNRGDAYGRGVYFAEDCMKCDEYTLEAPVGHCYAGLRPVLLCRVLLGRAAVSEDTDVSVELQGIMNRRYDSLIADRKAAVGTYREFVIFDADQAYADYILWYRRSY